MTKKNTIYIAAAAILLTACSSDEPGMLSQPAPASFSAQIGKTASRATGSEWSAGDAIGISGVSGAKTYSNVNYTTASGDGNFTPADNGIFYQTTDPVTFTAYYPYSVDLDADGIISASTADQSKPDSFDFLWAQASGSYDNPAVRFDFGHKMSLITLTFINGNDVNLEDLTYTVDGLTAEGTFDTATGEANALGNSATSMTAMTAPLTSDSKSSLIVFPQTVESVILNACVDGQQYACSLPLTELKSGHRYNFNLTVKKTALTATGCTISEWNDGGNNEAELNPVVTIGDKSPADASIGDFYMSDGSLVDKDASLTAVQKAACIGIVFTTDQSRIGEGAIAALSAKGVAPHGLVMALSDAVLESKWGDRIDEEGIVNNTVVNAMYALVDGYSDTQWIINNHADNLEDTYSVFYHANQYGKTDDTKQYAAPSKTTGWFLPSAGNWWDILRNLGKVEQLDDWKNSEENWFKIKNVGTLIVSNLNSSISKIDGAPQFSENRFFYWTSTEVADSVARFVGIYPNNDNELRYSNMLKGNVFNSVRCILAF